MEQSKSIFYIIRKIKKLQNLTKEKENKRVKERKWKNLKI